LITGITVENFKGIRDRVKLDFQPITLWFGANSARKSTIVHALHCAREVFERHNLDADQTIAGGKYIDLESYKRLVHRDGNLI
jgi:AAA15 family ATPase/GTPase